MTSRPPVLMDSWRLSRSGAYLDNFCWAVWSAHAPGLEAAVFAAWGFCWRGELMTTSRRHMFPPRVTVRSAVLWFPSSVSPQWESSVSFPKCGFNPARRRTRYQARATALWRRCHPPPHAQLRKWYPRISCRVSRGWPHWQVGVHRVGGKGIPSRSSHRVW